MTDKSNDYDALARRYLDLWQQEMAKLAQDPQAGGAWATLFQGMMQNAAGAFSQAAAPFTAAMTAGSPHARATTTSTGPATATATPGDGGVDVADVLRRIDARLGAIEQRLTALEATAPTRRRTRAPKT